MSLSLRSNQPGPQAPGGLSARPQRPARQLAFTAIAGLLLVALAAGCATPPTANAILGSAQAGEPVRINKASGAPLTAAQSRAVIEKLKGRTPQVGLLERHLAIEEAVNEAPLSTDNRAVLLQDGPATYAAMFREMEAAREHIFVESYIIEADETGEKFAAMWKKKVKEGVPVSLLYDSAGSMNTPKEYFQSLRDAGVAVAEFNPINPLKATKSWELNERDHRKLLLVDGRTAFVGGINISGVYSSGSAHRSRRAAQDTRPWRDTQVQVTGPVVVDLQKSFLEAWAKAAKEPPATKQKQLVARPAGKEVLRVLSAWADEPERVNPIYATFLSAITNAEKTIHISMAYFVPDPQTLQALQDAARRGVDVQLILPGFTDFGLVFHAGRSKYSDLLEAGVKIHERKERLLHAKTAVIDGVWSTVGSSNLDWRSFLHNHELNIVVLGPEFGDQMEAAFRRDIANSQPVTPETWRQRPATDRVKELAARVWEYWL